MTILSGTQSKILITVNHKAGVEPVAAVIRQGESLPLAGFQQAH